MTGTHYDLMNVPILAQPGLDLFLDSVLPLFVRMSFCFLLQLQFVHVPFSFVHLYTFNRIR